MVPLSSRDPCSESVPRTATSLSDMQLLHEVATPVRTLKPMGSRVAAQSRACSPRPHPSSVPPDTRTQKAYENLRVRFMSTLREYQPHPVDISPGGRALPVRSGTNNK